MRKTNKKQKFMHVYRTPYDLHIQQMVSNTLYTTSEEIDCMPSESDILHEPEKAPKIEVSFGLDAFTFQHTFKY